MELFGLPLDVNIVLGFVSGATGLITGYLGAKGREKDQLHAMSELIAQTNRELRQQLKEQEAECRKDSEALKTRIRNLEEQFLKK
jgi:hypothetical protein